MIARYHSLQHDSDTALAGSTSGYAPIKDDRLSDRLSGSCSSWHRGHQPLRFLPGRPSSVAAAVALRSWNNWRRRGILQHVRNQIIELIDAGELRTSLVCAVALATLRHRLSASRTATFDEGRSKRLPRLPVRASVRQRSVPVAPTIGDPVIQNLPPLDHRAAVHDRQILPHHRGAKP